MPLVTPLRIAGLVCVLTLFPAASHAGRLRVASHESQGSDAALLPANLHVPDVYRSVVEIMWRRSPTFRRQCARIAKASFLTVSVRMESADVAGARASARIERRSTGTLHATVQVGKSDDLAELLAHELEHIIEQLDGVDLPAMAARRVSGVYRTRDNGYDTIRAIRAGARVAHELRNADE